MKPKLPLFSKILLCFFLNIFVLAAIPAGLLKIRPQLPPDSPFGMWIGGRFPMAAHLLSMELSEARVEDWLEILARSSSTYRVTFTLFIDGGQKRIGPPLDKIGRASCRERV